MKFCWNTPDFIQIRQKYRPRDTKMHVSFILLAATYIVQQYGDVLLCFHGNTFNNHYTYQSFFLPTDAQLDSLKNNFKFALKLTLKTPTCFGVKHHHIREHTVWALLKLQLLKWFKIHWCGLFGSVVTYIIIWSAMKNIVSNTAAILY